MTQTTLDLTPFQSAFQARFGTVWTRQPKDAMTSHAWDATQSGQVAYAWNAMADKKAYPVMLLDVPDQLKKVSQVAALKLDTGAKCKVFVGQLSLAQDVLNQMDHDEDVRPEPALMFGDTEILELLEMGAKAQEDKTRKKATPEASVANAPEIPEGSPYQERDPFEEGAAMDASAVDILNTPATTEETPAPQAEKKKPGRKPKAGKPADVPADAPADAPAEATETKAEEQKPEKKLSSKLSTRTRKVLEGTLMQLEDAIRGIKDAIEAEEDVTDPLLLLATQKTRLDAAARSVARAQLRGDAMEDPEINPIVSIPALNIANEARALARDLELSPERATTWEATKKGFKALADRADSMNGVLHEEGISESVKASAPALRTEDGTHVEDLR